MVCKATIQLIFYIFFGLFVISSCKNDLSHAKKIETQSFNDSINITKDVKILVTEDDLLKAEIKAPVMEEATGKDAYYQMPEGIKMQLFDKQGHPSGHLSAHFAKQYVNTNYTLLQTDVVAVNVRGEKFYSNELIWDNKTRKFYSNKKVRIVLESGSEIFGETFWSNQDFSYYEVNKSFGKINLKETP